MPSRPVVLAVLAVALAAASTAVAPRPSALYVDTSPTDSEARSLMLTKWEQARTQGRDAFCGDVVFRSVCERNWEGAGGDAGVPRETPRVVASKAKDGYRWLTVCGQTGLGVPYESEFVIVRHGPGPVVIHLPVFWGKTRFRGVFDEGSEPGSTAETPYAPGC